MSLSFASAPCSDRLSGGWQQVRYVGWTKYSINLQECGSSSNKKHILIHWLMVSKLFLSSFSFPCFLYEFVLTMGGSQAEIIKEFDEFIVEHAKLRL